MNHTEKQEEILNENNMVKARTHKEEVMKILRLKQTDLILSEKKIVEIKELGDIVIKYMELGL